MALALEAGGGHDLVLVSRNLNSGLGLLLSGCITLNPSLLTSQKISCFFVKSLTQHPSVLLSKS